MCIVFEIYADIVHIMSKIMNYIPSLQTGAKSRSNPYKLFVLRTLNICCISILFRLLF